MDLYNNSEEIISKGVKLYKLWTCFVDVRALLDTFENNDIDSLGTVPHIEYFGKYTFVMLLQIVTLCRRICL
jgi:hypothetical protein